MSTAMLNRNTLHAATTNNMKVLIVIRYRFTDVELQVHQQLLQINKVTRPKHVHSNVT